jgi:hypothetical protein
MNPIAAFRNRLRQINTEVLHSPITDLSEEMAQTTQRFRSKYGKIARAVAG